MRGRLLPAERPAVGALHRIGQVAVRDLGEDARLAVIDHVLSRRRPHVVLVLPRHAFLAFRQERVRHRLADRALLHAQQRVHVRIERLGERRHEDASAGAALLMHVVGDDRLVLVLDRLDVHARFLLREHEPVAVVVVPDVLVIEVGEHALERRALRLVPVIDDQHLAVGVLRRHHQHDAAVENLANLRAVVGRQPVNDVDDRLAVADFG